MRETIWLFKHNPYHKLTDLLPISFRIWWKAAVAPLFGRAAYDVIIPETEHHAAWLLGSQPPLKLFKRLKKQGNLTLVSLVTDEELKLSPQLTAAISCYHQNWYDHSYLNQNSGKNITVSDFVEWIKKIFYPFKNRDKNVINQFYCHCMAGQARSLIATLTFLYLYPYPKELFDFALWPKEFLKDLPQALQERLQNQRDLTAIWQFVKLKRPQVRKLGSLDGEQLGLLGLLKLHLDADLYRRNKIGAVKLVEQVKEYVWFLDAPFSLAFRTEQDLAEELDDFALLYQAYLDQGRNLAFDLCNIADCREIKYQDDFGIVLQRLDSIKQLRLLICLSKVENLGSLITKEQLEQAVMRIFKFKSDLLPGELILCLKIWGDKLHLINDAYFKRIIKLIFEGNAKAQYQRIVLLQQLLSLSFHPATMLLYLQQNYVHAPEIAILTDFYAKFNP